MAMQPHPELSSHGDDRAPGYQPETISLRAVWWFVIVFVVFAVLSHVLLWIIYSVFSRSAAQVNLARSAIVEPVMAPEPRLQPSRGHESVPWQDLEQLNRANLAEFERRGWLDKQTGRIVIPDSIVQQVRQLSAQSTTRPIR